MSEPNPEPTMSEDDTIMAAQARLIARRKAEGIPSQTLAEARAAAQWHQTREERSDESLGAILARGVALAVPASPPAPETQAQRVYRLAAGFSDANISDIFTVCSRGCNWREPRGGYCPCGSRLEPVTWKRLVGLIGSEGVPALGGVEDSRGRLLTGIEAVAELRRRLTASKVVLLGDTRAGKSIAAAAFAAGEILKGSERVRWCATEGLDGPGMLDRATSGRTIIVDGIGEELKCAGPGTGLVAQRCVPVADLFGELYRLRGKQVLVTTYLPFENPDPRTPGMAELYGANIASRVYEGAETVRIRRAPC